MHSLSNQEDLNAPSYILIRILDTVIPFYTDTWYNDNFRYTDKLAGTKLSLKRPHLIRN